MAVKTVVFSCNSLEDMPMQRAAGEAAIAYNLHHPNIVNTYSHNLTAITSSHSDEIMSWKLDLVQVCSTLPTGAEIRVAHSFG